MTAKKVSLMDFEGNPNIGIYMFVNDKFCLIGPQVSKKKLEEIKDVINVPIYQVSMLNTDLIGIFANGNNDFLVVPEIYEYEQEELEKICKEHDTRLIVMEERQNTFGNNICVGDGVVLINPEYREKFERIISKITKYKVIRITTKEFEAIGSTCKYVNGKYFLSQEYEENDVKEILDNVAGVGTVNKGNNYISSGIVGNKFGVIIGAMSSSVEIQNIVESCDYL